MSPAHLATKPDSRHRTEAFRQDVFRGLSAIPKTLPSKYFYDVRGSRLFDRICGLDEYYLARTEMEIMNHHAAEMAACLGRHLRLVEYGSGSSVKTRRLLDALESPSLYVPVDVSQRHLHATAERLRADYPGLPISPVVADFTQPFGLPAPPPGEGRTCIYFPGSTIGNYRPRQAAELLQSVRRLCGAEGLMLIGVDLQKSDRVLHAAYNDRQGVTAAFNKNVLRRINRELDADFDLDAFTHRAFYNHKQSRIEMHLQSRHDQVVMVTGRPFTFQRDETICTELSHKYTVTGFECLAAETGWETCQVWCDSRRYFAVILLRCGAAPLPANRTDIGQL